MGVRPPEASGVSSRCPPLTSEPTSSLSFLVPPFRKETALRLLP